ncbi:MAG: hypothetical protein KatS3mg007_1448 [Thermoanaerobaculum sp.]|nr:MAG: hypothetical protein KatS3mg007_1448 [Thermoanaerobaculum sp.]
MHYVPSDHLGSPQKITDGSGNVVASNDFYPFGLPAATTGLQGSWFSGYELEHQDTASTYTDDLYFLHAYFPQVARFLSPDPVRGDVFSPQSFNLFAYVSGNPANFVDPWGLAASGSSSGDAGVVRLPDGRICVMGDDGQWHCGLDAGGVTVTAQPIPGEGISDEARRQRELEEMGAWMALHDRAAFAGQRISSHGFVFSQSNAWANSNSPQSLAVLEALRRQLQPGPGPCRTMSFREKFWINFGAVNSALFGIPLARPGLTAAGYVGSQFVKEAAGLPTFFDWAKQGFGGLKFNGARFTALESGISVGTNVFAGRILALPAFEVGAAVDSAYQAWTETCEYFSGIR